MLGVCSARTQTQTHTHTKAADNQEKRSKPNRRKNLKLTPCLLVKSRTKLKKQNTRTRSNVVGTTNLLLDFLILQKGNVSVCE